MAAHRTKQRRGKDYTIKGILFDLDDTLADTYRTLSKKAAAKADKVLAKSLGRSEKKIKSLRKSFAETGLPFHEQTKRVCHQLGVKGKALRDACLLADEFYFVSPSLTGFKLFPGVRAMLKKLRDHHHLVLITFGNLETQQAKIDKLKLRGIFDILYIEEYKTGSRSDKTELFRKACKRLKLKPEEMVVVGDNPSHEIAVGNKVGMATVRVHAGRRKNVKAKNDYELADFDIKKTTDVKKILEFL